MSKRENRLSVLIMASVRWYNASAHYAFFLAEQLKSAGFDVVIFGIPGSPIILKAKESGIEVIDCINLMKGPVSYIRGLFKFRRLVLEKGFNIIHPHFSRDHNFAWISLIGKGFPIIRTRSDVLKPKKNPLNILLYRKTAVHYTVPSGSLVRMLVSMKVKSNNISVIPLGIDYSLFSNYQAKRNLKDILQILDERVVVTFIGRLHKIKGVEHFIDSYRYISDKNRFHFIISGEEIDLSVEHLKAHAKIQGISNISFLERQDDVREILSITDIGVIPSVDSEVICRVALEMFSFGIPVIGSDINSIPEVISRYEGVVVNPGRPKEIAEAIEGMVCGDRYREMSERIKSSLNQSSPERFISGYISIYRMLMR